MNTFREISFFGLFIRCRATRPLSSLPDNGPVYARPAYRARNEPVSARDARDGDGECGKESEAVKYGERGIADETMGRRERELENV